MKTFIATAVLASLIGASASFAAPTAKTTTQPAQSTASTQTAAQLNTNDSTQQSSSSEWQFKAPTKKPHHRNEYNG
ncbi:hypothetical protein GOZ83_06075 [Agrobacterium vitis]|uniref:hypothetical protein n=1 Tax=Rhizobium/Agrobacterium group TaxID=227290 RepID=UPI0012E8662F|nr:MULTISPECIES: hypothetical protein [Rhizobium/Agrobacterium group]MCF1446467.1 hypothetical protein [Allorhizobium ampelinum]MCF1492655.1 hypothetical protein [Allorhizobium ampelinum]MVA44649.1 hypothetical protein [Agrobacterium vitis]